MKKTFYLLIFCLLSLFLKAANFYKVPDSQDIEFNSMIAVNDSNVLIVGFTGDSVSRGIIFQSDINGDTIWSKTYTDSLSVHFRSVALNFDSSRIVVVGELEDSSDTEVGLMMELDMTGNIQWQKKFLINSSNIRFKEISFINSASFAVSVNENDYAYLLVCDTSGNVYRVFAGASFSDIAAPIVSIDGSLFISAVVYNSFDNSSINIGIRTDTSFSVLYWSNVYNGFTNNTWGTAGKKGIAMNDGGFVFSNTCETIFSMRCSVYRVDSTGRALWSIEGGPHVTQFSNGSYLFSNGGFNPTSIGLIRMDSSALSFTNYTGVGGYDCNGIVSLGDKILGISSGNFYGFDSIGCHMTILNNNPDSNYNYPVDPYQILMSTNYQFPSNPVLISASSGIGLLDDCNSIGVNEFSPSSISIFPNPNEGVFRISFGEMLFHPSLMRITDFTGITHLTKVLNDSGNSMQEFNLSNLPKGAYIIEVIGSGYSSAKLIIQ